MIKVDTDKCKRCGRCVRVCPASVYRLDKGEVPVVEKPKNCIQCGHCVDVCEADALQHDSFPPEHIHRIRTELIPSPESLMELMKSRCSNRTITEQPIPAEALADIIEYLLSEGYEIVPVSELLLQGEYVIDHTGRMLPAN